MDRGRHRNGDRLAAGVGPDRCRHGKRVLMAGCPAATVSASAHAAPPGGLQRNQKSLVAQIVGDFAIQQDGASAMKRLELLPGRWMSWWRERNFA